VREKLRSLTHGPWAYPVAGFLGFAEASFLITPTEPLMIPMMASRGRTVWLLALCPVLGNILAGLLMYWLGATLAEPAIEPLVRWMDAENDYRNGLERLSDHGFLTLFFIGITPFPFQIGTAAAGVAGYPLGMFVLAVGLSRALRYFALAALVRIVGLRAQDWIERHELEIFAVGTLLFGALTIYLIFF